VSDSIIVYRNPLEKWFWEGGAIYIGAAILALILIAWAIYIGAAILALILIAWAWSHWDALKAKRLRKERYLAMNEAQRARWRYSSPRNSFEAEDRERGR
jgi:hypothetical protein